MVDTRYGSDSTVNIADKQTWLERIASGDPVRTLADVTIVKHGLTSGAVSIPVSRVQVNMSAASVPYARAEIDLATPLPDGFTDPVTQLADITVVAGLTHAEGETSDQLAHLVFSAAHAENGKTTLTCLSDDSLLKDIVLPSTVPETACPQQATMSGIWLSGPASKMTVGEILPIKNAATIPADRQANVWAQPYGGGDAPLDWLLTQADIAGLYLHSDQSPGSTGGLIAEYALAVNPADCLDLSASARYPMMISASADLGLVDDYASAIYLTCQWTESGTRKEASGLISAAAGITQVCKTITMQMRPPAAYRAALTSAWSPALALARRVAARTWQARYQTPLLPWLRPGDTVKTDYGYGLIRDISFDLTLGTQNLTVRPF